MKIATSLTTSHLLLLTLSTIVPGGVATLQQNVLTDDNVLTCFVPGPDGGSVPEDTRVVSLQPNITGTVWLPMVSGYVIMYRT